MLFWHLACLLCGVCQLHCYQSSMLGVVCCEQVG
uniref:Nitrous oxide-stimulated promoter n=1 Tax=Siphoviridae sp. ct6bU4 TaxID=2825344 RepID=A0A8S5VAU0_9CAUD|nr:MAG TPA: Nitrous oxide-stimulated promoter [Siphoviridae sp. ct6bU4]